MGGRNERHEDAGHQRHGELDAKRPSATDGVGLAFGAGDEPFVFPGHSRTFEPHLRAITAL
jgi:hypothetical protein